MTEEQFSACVRATWRESNGPDELTSNLYPIDLGISNEAFRTIYRERDPTFAGLPALLFDNLGGGTLLLERLLPMILGELTPILESLQKRSAELRSESRRELTTAIPPFRGSTTRASPL